MNFADTSVLCALYREQDNSSAAHRLFAEVGNVAVISSLVELEFRQSVRLNAFRFSKDRTQGYPAREAENMFLAYQSDLAGNKLRPVSVDWSVVHRLTEQLSTKYTMFLGNRLVDILHVATALHLGADTFLTFDYDQAALARAVGLNVPRSEN
jgi:predicted nucleic acid-binding protein